ncbi:unnamed protein product [Schistocephalus solidus]|uniref:Solute carrier family 10 member 6 n=1 Tax=Schistocephalus solidus TaxID=70667 RepID=A0A183SP53_SCHSO|nr:unnamed protein product [Schistocephalus solidus]
MQYSLLFLCIHATLQTREVAGFGRGGRYVQETIGGLVVDPQDAAERERINEEMDANMVKYGDTDLLLSHFQSNDGKITLNVSCNKSELVFELKKTPHQVTCNLTCHLKVPIALSFEVDYPPVAYSAPAFWLYLQPTSSGQSTICLNLTIQGERMGVAYLRIWAREAIKQSGAGAYEWHNWNRSEPLLVEAYLSTLVNRSEFDSGGSGIGLPVKILRPRGVLEVIFRVVVACLVIGITFVMGCELDPRLIWMHLKKPVGPLIGFCCQFGIMPLIAFGIAMVVPIKPEFGFGLLTTGCCPGGGGSNVWTLLLHGDLNLSMTMTFISSIAALGMMPLMLFIYGRFFLDIQQIRIPYEQIAIQLLYVVIPVIVGMLVKYCLPKMAAHIRRFLRPLAVLFIVILVGFGTYVNLPIYVLMGQYLLLLPTAAALPWLGFLTAGLVAFLFQRSRAEILTIAIETGIQNVGIAILVLIYSMPQPEGDIGAVMPLVVSLFTPLPLMIALIVVCIREARCVCCRRRPPRTSHAQNADVIGSCQDEEGDESDGMLAVRS